MERLEIVWVEFFLWENETVMDIMEKPLFG
jgi:hypothetical protein